MSTEYKFSNIHFTAFSYRNKIVVVAELEIYEFLDQA